MKVSRTNFGFSSGDAGGDAPASFGAMSVASSRGTLAAGGGERAFSGLSSAARAEVEALAARVEKESDVREDIVASLRARVEAGSYNVSGEQIAEMMVRRILADQVR